jgi:hypothetical protein
MDLDFGNSSFIYFIIVLCMFTILFYLYYKMYVKINVHSEQLEKIDNFIKSVIMSSAEKLSKTGSSNKEKFKKTIDDNDNDNEDKKIYETVNENLKNETVNEKTEKIDKTEKNDEDLSDLN